MANPYVGEIRLFAGNFAPTGWALCQGQTLEIAQNEALFSLLGTTYGGNGQTTFALPDLRSRIPVHQGTNGSNGITYVMGMTGGEEQVTLTVSQIPHHTHAPQAQSAPGNQQGPGRGFWAQSNVGQFSSSAPNAIMGSSAISSTGGGQAHNNIMPYVALNFIIALFGIFPSRN
ncbi:MAG: phage tail protein [Isosphaeraceae bacterium]